MTIVYSVAETMPSEAEKAVAGAPELVLMVMVTVIALSGYSALDFATRYDRRGPAVVALVSLLGFVPLVDVLWGSVYYVSCLVERSVSFDSAVRSLTVPVLSVVGLLGAGLVFLMVVRREVSGRDSIRSPSGIC
jgi:ABC-type sugar transport system permease subunit